MSIRRQEKTISPFFVVLNWLVCLQPDWILHGLSPQTHPLSTTEPLKLIETYLYPKTITKSPIHLQGCIRRKQTDKQPTDTDRQQEILVSMYDWVNLELTHYFGKTLKSQDCFHLTLLRHQIIKTSLCTISKNSWVLPFLVNLTPVTMKLQLTVFLDHPVVQSTDCSS